MSLLDTIKPFVDAGFAIHWLKPRSKAPAYGDGWSEAPVASFADLQRSYRDQSNVGVRLGELSRMTAGGYLHVIDLDIRIPDLADEAWGALTSLLPDVDIELLPCVRSGSGGESRHLYFVTSKPFFGRKIAVSEGKHRHFDKARNKDVWSCDWEIELFGTGKQVAMPPSVHPETGRLYAWERHFDFDSFDGLPCLPAADIEALGAAETSTYAFESREPLTFKAGELERDLGSLPVDQIDDRMDWVTLGQALHHQFGGSTEGFDLWMDVSSRGSKFLVGSNRTKELRRYRGFGKNRRQPVTMATVKQWAQEARSAALMGELDDLDDDVETDFQEDDFDALIGAELPKTTDSLSDDWDGGKVEATDLDWKSLLDPLEDGKGWRPTLHNVELIVKNDKRLVGLPQLNEFTQETVQRSQPGVRGKSRANAAKPTRELTGRVWEVKDTLNGEIWSSSRDYAIRSILEAPRTQGGYGMKITDRDLKAATVLAAWDNSFHPVREYLNGLKWDGKPRVEELFVKYLGSENSSYNRSVARIMMIAGVTRIFEPGAKYDFAVILEGLQGRGKSTFIRTLGKRWFAELEGDFHDGKEMVEKMQGAWIMEIPELSGFNRADVRSIKAFISRQVDKVRLAYEARAQDFPRQCILIGSTNDREYLKDDTGGRRFFPMECHVDMIDVADLRQNVDQLWAEAHALYRAMRAAQPHDDLPLYLVDADAAAEAARLQESRRVESSDDAMVGKITAWLDRPVSSGGIDDEGEGGVRNVTCLLELWAALGNDPRAYGALQAQSLGRAMSRVSGWKSTGRLFTFPHPMGRQRYYERLGSPGIMAPISPK